VTLRRSSGILLHPTSLPGPSGIGSLGDEAFDFIDFLAETGQKAWQVLPLGPTGYGDSPYQCFSAFAGNPLLISLGKLVSEGWLLRSDISDAPAFSDEFVDYGAVIGHKLPLLRKSFDIFDRQAPSDARDQFDAFCLSNRDWLEDYALFMAVKDLQGGVAWTRWEPEIATRQPAAVRRFERRLAREIRSCKYAQFQFFRQWDAVRAYCRDRDIRIIGDVPIFVAHDSADVWSLRELFDLEPDGTPRVVAGVPPDYFSATGQLWGNPIYRWDAIASSGFRWWVGRLRAALSLVDVVRLDHFRGFEAYWEVPGKAATAANGRWVKGPGAALFDRLQEELGDLPIIAENLGVITPPVEELRNRYDFPGMAILQFAFGTDPQAPDFKPHNYPRNLAVYTGTHDNDTIVGWWNSAEAGESTRSLEDVKNEKDLARKYLATDGSDIHWVFIRAVLSSVAKLAVIPLQDVLGLGSEARMNTPSKPTGNWRWRYNPCQLTSDLRERLRELTSIYDR
jgi:4-alpha-glucanotransferase